MKKIEIRRLDFIAKITVCFFCFIFTSCNRQTEIIQLTDLSFANSPFALESLAKNNQHNLYFVVAYPPKNQESLLNLLLNHFKSFTTTVNINNYHFYYHFYFKETKNVSRNYIERAGNTLDDNIKLCFAVIKIEPRHNMKTIIFYRKDRPQAVEKEIILPLKEDGVLHKHNKKRIIFYKLDGSEERVVYE